MKVSLPWRRLWSVRSGVTATLLILAFALIYGNALWRVDNLLYDWHQRRWSQPAPDDVVIVAIDEQSLAEIGRWPWSRRIHAKMLDKLTEAGARVVAFDILFAEPDRRDPGADLQLARAISESGVVVLPVVQEALFQNGPLKLTRPIPELEDVAAAIGHVDTELDGDTIARSAYLTAGLGFPHWPSLSLAILEMEDPKSWLEPPGQRNPNVQGAAEDAWVRDNRILFPFSGPPGHFKRISYDDVLNGRVPQEDLRGKLILVGTTAAGLGDILPTPVSGEASPMPGVEFHANVLDAVRYERIVTPLNPFLTGLITALLILIPGWIFARFSPRFALLNTVLTVVAAATGSLLLLRHFYIWFPPSVALLCLSLSYPLWSWRQLAYTVKFLRGELTRLKRDPGLASPQKGFSLPATMDYLQNIMPIEGLELRDTNGKIIKQWGQAPQGTSQIPASNWTRNNNSLWRSTDHKGGRLGVRWPDDSQPDARQLGLLNMLQGRLHDESQQKSSTTTEMLEASIQQVQDATLRLSQMRQFMSDSLAHMADGVIVADPLGRVLLANARAEDYLGMKDSADLEGSPIMGLFDHLAFDNPDAKDQALQGVLQDRNTATLNARSGDDREMLVQVAPFAQAEDQFSGLIVTLADVTPVKRAERNRAEHALMLEKERAQVTLHSIADAVITTGPDGKVEYMNPTAERLTGYPAPDASGLTLDRVMHLVDPRSGRAFSFEALSENTSGAGRGAILRCRSGGEFEVMASSAEVLSPQGQILGSVIALSDITEAKRLQREIAVQANKDPLTGLPNRQWFDRTLDQLLSGVAEHPRGLAILLVNLDRFKAVNEGLGHNVGDALLIAVSQRLSEFLGNTAVLARHGGDEFVIVLDEYPYEEHVSRTGYQLIEALKAPFTLEDRDFFISASVGVALYPKDGSNVEDLLKAADTAVLRAKDRGRNNVQFCAEDMNVRARESLELEQSLRRALNRDEFELHYQPQVDLVTGKIIGAEALLRWHNPELGMISPARFVPIAEDSGLIIEISEWVLHTACTLAKTWQDQNLSPVRMAVNLSPLQFVQEDTPQVIERTLKHTGLRPQTLNLEITESLIMKDVESAIRTLERLKAMGMELDIDDFGTGYSSLAYINRFPINRLKVDQSFVKDIKHRDDNAAIVKAIIAMAKGLGLKVIAEGVEDLEQLAFLKKHGCDEMQGYYFSRPVVAEEMQTMLTQGKNLFSELRDLNI